jgi:hypothetical protein
MSVFSKCPVLPELMLSAAGGGLLASMLRHDASRPETFSDEVLEIYRANVSAPGGNRCGGQRQRALLSGPQRRR